MNQYAVVRTLVFDFSISDTTTLSSQPKHYRQPEASSFPIAEFSASSRCTPFRPSLAEGDKPKSSGGPDIQVKTSPRPESTEIFFARTSYIFHCHSLFSFSFFPAFFPEQLCRGTMDVASRSSHKFAPREPQRRYSPGLSPTANSKSKVLWQMLEDDVQKSGPFIRREMLGTISILL